MGNKPHSNDHHVVETQNTPNTPNKTKELSTSSNPSNAKRDRDRERERKRRDRRKEREEEIVPEQVSRHYLSIAISSQWNDSKLIPDLVRHISQHTGKHIGDAYIANRVRLGFFTAKTL